MLFVAAGPVMVSPAGTRPSCWPRTASRRASSRCRGCATSTARGSREIGGGAPIVTLDNHYVVGGQGDAVLAALAADAPEAALRVQKIGVTEVPKSGGNDETLRAHGLDADGIRRQVQSGLPSRV